ncbi:MAG TPA: DNA-directed RNA polymerase subunit alpha C-terminal domain-containing protein [Candidatus Acidoferrum sp.]|nr:DNA-directed RNA polymerase subunit alpha C-terminal domain-containing protein [Candidatus Acidoferrum sp.]
MAPSRRTFLKAIGAATVALAVGSPEHFIKVIAAEWTPIEMLGLQMRLANALKAYDIATVGQLLSKGQDDLLGMRSIGRFCLGHIAEMLVERGFASEYYVDSIYPEARHQASAQTQFRRFKLHPTVLGTPVRPASADESAAERGLLPGT